MGVERPQEPRYAPERVGLVPTRLEAFRPGSGSLVSFRCPICERASHNPDDEQERYCAACHGYTEERPPAGMRWVLLTWYVALRYRRRLR